MDIGFVLRRAWEITWKNKVLWIFGILASCSSGGGGPNFNLNYRQQPSSTGKFELPFQIQRFFNNLTQAQITLLIVAGILAILLLVIISVFLGTIGRIGLIRGTLKAEASDERLAFGELFRSSLPFFWRVFLLNLIVGILTAVAIGGLLVLGFLGTIATLGVGLICLIPLICLLIPVVWFINLVLRQATIAIVIEDAKMMDGLSRGWEVIKSNFGSIFVMWLILGLGISLIIGVIISLPVLLVIAPAVIGAIAGTGQALKGGLLITGLCLIVYLPVLIILNGALRSYIESAWTLTFLSLTHPKPEVDQIPDAVS